MGRFKDFCLVVGGSLAIVGWVMAIGLTLLMISELTQ
jgi:hypothetical protein